VDENQVRELIERLVAEEHALLEREAHGGADEDDRQRLETLKVTLDRSWDLLRQRRALREANRDADDASVRSADVVEGYEQ